jgi:Sugar (and other) transporter
LTASGRKRGRGYAARTVTLLSAIGNAGTFFLFAGLSIVALAYFQRQVPETKNRSLQDIERDLDLPEGYGDLHHRPVSHTHL